jgi:quinol monooxygenase YgiN
MSSSPQMIAYEAYNVREDLYETHFHSKAMDVFLSKIPATMTTGLDLTHFEDTAGFEDKTPNMKECGIFYVTRIIAKSGKRADVLERLQKLAQWVAKNEDDTYTYLVLKSLDNDVDIRIFERYATRKALEAHMKRAEVLDFHMSSKYLIASMEGRGYIPNGAGWLHR